MVWVFVFFAVAALVIYFFALQRPASDPSSNSGAATDSGVNTDAKQRAGTTTEVPWSAITWLIGIAGILWFLFVFLQVQTWSWGGTQTVRYVPRGQVVYKRDIPKEVSIRVPPAGEGFSDPFSYYPGFRVCWFERSGANADVRQQVQRFGLDNWTYIDDIPQPDRSGFQLGRFEGNSAFSRKVIVQYVPTSERC